MTAPEPLFPTAGVVKSFWEALEDLPGGRALEVTWQRRLAGYYQWFRPFLSPTTDLAGAYPCTRVPPCGCDHAVREDQAWGFASVCVCGDGDCDAIPLAPSDVVVYALDWTRLARSLGKVLPGLSPSHPTAGGDGEDCVHLGLYEPAAAPVLFCCPRNEAHLRAVIGRLGRGLEQPFILLSPTARVLNPETVAALRRELAVAIPLAGRLEPILDCPAQFQWRGSLDPLLAEWLARIARRRDDGRILRSIYRQIALARKSVVDLQQRAEPLGDDVARQVFGVIKQLEPNSSAIKAPLVQVFRLYCLESLSAAEVARRCGCSKALIVLRLQELERKLGRRPAQLRGLSTQFEQIEESLSDPRALRINRRKAIAGEEFEEGLPLGD